MSRARVPAVACFGEILWDCLPRGLFLGGAPMNAAYHLARQGLRVVAVTAVGRDILGDEARRRVAGWGIDVRFMARHANRPTGTVQAVLDARGMARYEIARGVAWDRIEAPPQLRRISPRPDAIVYGTLALRETANRRALARLLDAWPGALRVVDLNFRPPFDGEAVTQFTLRSAQLVKLNDLELRRLARERARTPDALARAARRFAREHGIQCVCVTAGERGAGLWWHGEWSWENARPVKVRDTVGAGDAFLGGLLGAILARHAEPRVALAQACRMGEFVATQDGATPDYRLGDDGSPVV
ncbi:MAG TPA: PfkB family carbohydrate kinase [Opitutus sp.]|nr:PfkB family carbohydrate kinase [Opitutus sp.]